MTVHTDGQPDESLCEAVQVLAPEEQMGAYSDAVGTGQYEKVSGLTGKYDNVRRYWEDEMTRLWLRSHLARQIQFRTEQMQRLRLLDLGCGSGDGFELLCEVRRTDPSLTAGETRLLTPEVLEHYKGVDLCEELLAQASSLYGAHPKMEFVQGDFTEALPVEEGEAPYDLYFTSYGTFSHHNDDTTLVRMLTDIARHVKDRALIVGDWIGRYSYEWQELWTNQPAERLNMDYVISYIYDDNEREARREEMQHIFLRMMTPEEIMACVQQASEAAGVEIKLLGFRDRSMLVGRHMDTAEYNPYAQKLRRAVNELHEVNWRTDLSRLCLDYVPKPGFEFLNSFFGDLQMRWNTLVRYTAQMLEDFDPELGSIPQPPQVPASYPEPLRHTIERMAAVINGVGWLEVGGPRENIIEPQLGYELRSIEMQTQRGQGCAHGLVGIFEIVK